MSYPTKQSWFWRIITCNIFSYLWFLKKRISSITFLKEYCECPQGLDISQWSCSSHFPSVSPAATAVLPPGRSWLMGSCPKFRPPWSDFFLPHRNLEEGQRKPEAVRYGGWIWIVLSAKITIWGQLNESCPRQQRKSALRKQEEWSKCTELSKTRACNLERLSPQFPGLLLLSFHSS